MHCDSSIPPHKETDCHDDDRDQDCDLDHIRQCHVSPKLGQIVTRNFRPGNAVFKGELKERPLLRNKRQAAYRNED
jgi:hypothetical protein